jgi:hypothetical protein
MWRRLILNKYLKLPSFIFCRKCVYKDDIRKPPWQRGATCSRLKTNTVHTKKSMTEQWTYLKEREKKFSLHNIWLMYMDQQLYIIIYRPPVTRAPDFKDKVPVRFFFYFFIISNMIAQPSSSVATIKHLLGFIILHEKSLTVRLKALKIMAQPWSTTRKCFYLCSFSL